VSALHPLALLQELETDLHQQALLVQGQELALGSYQQAQPEPPSLRVVPSLRLSALQSVSAQL
jgi:hypothetical protein